MRAKYDCRPRSFAGRFWRWHINFCPGWKAYFSSLTPDGYSGDMHPLIPVKCTHLLNYQFDKVILFFLNCLLLTRFYALCELPCL